MNKAILLLFFGSWGFFTLFHPGRPMTVDGAVTLDTVRAMARGGLAIPQALVTRPGREGKHYSKYGPALPVLSLPAYCVGMLLERDSPEPGNPECGLADQLALTANQWISAGILVLLFLIGVDFGLSKRIAFSIAVISGVSTMILPYSRDYFSQPPAAFFVLAAAFFLMRFDNQNEVKWLYGASLSMGLAILSRLDMAVLVPGFAVWLGLSLWKTVWARPKAEWLRVALAGTPFLACIGIELLFDWMRWGSVWGDPYGNQRFNRMWIDTIPRLLFSPTLSVFLYNPLLPMSLSMMAFTWRRYGHAWISILICDISYLLLVGKFEDYHGGVCPGPRYLLALVPLNLIPLFACLALRKRVIRAVFPFIVLAGLIGAMMNVYEATVDYTTQLPAWDFWMMQLDNL